ncbi:MAG: hypothetical protein DDT18_01221 [Actinobacteria bacterium]|nr:hypothetical protein [Actinomycetota bacterium]
MNDKLGPKVTSGGDDRLSGWQTALLGNDLFTFLQNGRPSGPVDGPIDSPATHEAAVSGINNSFGLLFGDISLDQ